MPIDLASRATRNHLLAALPAAASKVLLENARLVRLVHSQVLYEAGDTIADVCFPVGAIISLLYLTENGSSSEIAIVGEDGFVGLGALLSGKSMTTRAAVEIAGEALCVPAAKAKALFDSDFSFRDVILRYVQATVTQISQTAVCNRRHTIEQQLCRWLLFNDDMIDSHKVSVTQELIANTLGVRRGGVSAAASALQRSGIIKYARGKITIVDRKGLEAAACECYRVVTDDYRRLFGHTTRRDNHTTGSRT